MQILLADPDRDLLSGYRRLMEKSGNSVQTAFDGTQILSLLGNKSFDLAVLNEHLPRIAHERMIHSLYGEKIPVIVLLDRPVHIRHLCQKEPASAYLPFPFSPSELRTLARNVLDKSVSPVRLNCADTEIHIDGFRFSGTDIRLTTDEIDILTRLSAKETPLPYQQRVYIHSLNAKLAELDSPSLRISYREEKGYRLVKL